MLFHCAYVLRNFTGNVDIMNNVLIPVFPHSCLFRLLQTDCKFMIKFSPSMVCPTFSFNYYYYGSTVATYIGIMQTSQIQ